MHAFYTVGLLILSNLFMTFAWYGHLKFKSSPLMTVILISWGIAFFEYILQVPANRIGASIFSVYQLRILQEALSLSVFIAFAAFYFGEMINFRYALSLGFIFLALVIAFYK